MDSIFSIKRAEYTINQISCLATEKCNVLLELLRKSSGSSSAKDSDQARTSCQTL